MATPSGVTDWAKWVCTVGEASGEWTRGRILPKRMGAKVEGRRPRRVLMDMVESGGGRRFTQSAETDLHLLQVSQLLFLFPCDQEKGEKMRSISRYKCL